MKILFLGDIVGNSGCAAVRKYLPKKKILRLNTGRVLHSAHDPIHLSHEKTKPELKTRTTLSLRICHIRSTQNQMYPKIKEFKLDFML